MTGGDQYRDILRQYWGYDDFRGIQRGIIESIGSGHDTLGLMPTGGGKSITFQVPALAQQGTCIIITPLISLMKDQVQHLRNRGIKATAVYSGMTHSEILTALDNCILGDYKFLYVAPERLESELFLAKLSHMRVNFITVDEAHCISQWGYDFRPSYLQIARIRLLVPHAPMLALTATATPAVMDDIQRQLHFGSDARVLRMSFERKNLTYIVRHAPDKKKEILHILGSVPGSAIIYTRSRQQTDDIAQMLTKEGISATFYHAGLAQIHKDDRQERWHSGEYRVMVATNAFGMGIDKADVRLVMHVEIPDSPEAYFQEAGRAGRDGKRAYAVLLYEEKDCQKLYRRIPEIYPEPDYIRDVYEQMCYYFQMAMGDGEGVTREFDLSKFCLRFKRFPVPAHSALVLLNNAGYISYSEEDETVSRLRFSVTRDELYRLNEQNDMGDMVIKVLLRKYSGLFADFVYISEALIAHETGLTADQVYHTLKSLSSFRIIDYIPRKRTNYITFTSRRIEKADIILPPAVYEERKEQYDKRIGAMIQYVTDKEVCHSRYLLSYFGETNAHNCGKCDICLPHKHGKTTEEAIHQSILRQLQGKPLRPQDLDYTGFQKEHFAQAVRHMLAEELITMDREQRLTLWQGRPR